jgi:hypothetical protein
MYLAILIIILVISLFCSCDFIVLKTIAKTIKEMYIDKLFTRSVKKEGEK